MDADKEGFLRSERSLIQTIGSCARIANGKCIMYADKITESMDKAITETRRRREIQNKFNEENGIVPKTIIKEVRELISNVDETKKKDKSRKETKLEKELNAEEIEREMREAAKNLDFERAMELRDILFEIKSS